MEFTKETKEPGLNQNRKAKGGMEEIMEMRIEQTQLGKDTQKGSENEEERIMRIFL